MKWIIEGANPKSGTELVREVEAPTAAEAERIAVERGLLVSKVKPGPVEVLPYAAEQGQLPLKPVEITAGPVFICPNPNCGFRGPSARQERGSPGVGFLLLLLAIVPGILYFALCCGYKHNCPNCGIEVKI
jgi:hypothetical protein